VARWGEGRRDRVASLEAAPFRRAAPADAGASGGGGEASPLRVLLAPADARDEGSLRFRVSLRAREGRRRVYVRPDSWRFDVRGPRGETTRCAMAAANTYPSPDLFSTLTVRRGPRASLEATYYCERGTFERAGIYEVVPSVELLRDGEEWNLDAVTGVHSGPPAPVRIRSGDGRYHEHGEGSGG